MKRPPIIWLILASLVFLFYTTKTTAQTISSYSILVNCLTVDTEYVVVSGCTSADSLVTFYGDGTFDTTLVTCSGSSGLVYRMRSHVYATYGVYSLKLILLSGGVAVDSINHTSELISCQDIHCFVYNDVNADCTFDSGDRYIYNAPAILEIDSSGIPIETITSTCGFSYLAFGTTGTVYAFKVIASPYGFYMGCPADVIVYDTLGVTVNEPNIGFQCNPVLPFDLAVTANFSAGLTGAGSHIFITNSSCSSASVPVPATLTLNYSPKYLFSGFGTGGGTYPYTLTGNTVTFNIGDVSVDSLIYFLAGFTPVGTLMLGDTVNATFTLNPLIGDDDTTNNIIVTNDIIYVSHDPNYKSVMPAGNINAGTLLKYIVSFENDGNDTAFNIHIMDTLSDNLDINTFKVITASAPMNLILLTSGGHNIVKFDFPNINLLDTSHHNYCYGMVSYTIQAKTGLAIGTKIDNEAGIYFDVNPVVMTNNVENIIDTPSATSLGILKTALAQVEVYPNPACTSLTIVSTTQPINQITITNILGQAVYSNKYDTTKAQIDVSSLPTGLYFVKINGSEVRKFVKE